MKLIATKGLPGSGKTYWAKEQQKQDPNIVLVCKDGLRTLLHQGVHSKGREKIVINIRDNIIETSLKDGHNVIVHDTNLAQKHMDRFMEIAKIYGAEFSIKDFTNVPLAICIERNRNRLNPVPKEAIFDMYKKYFRKTPPTVQFLPELHDAIICDVDGTLALFGDKSPYDRDYENDDINIFIREILIKMCSAYRIIILSGRMNKHRDVTANWLMKHNVPYNELFMRATDDVRNDAVVKKEIYDTQIKNKYNVHFVLDDRNRVVDMWRNEIGLICLQVAEGDF